MAEVKYAKGEKPRDLDAAVGGLVLERTQSWQKDPDDFHPLGSGMNGPFNTQTYAKGKGADPEANRTGCKSLSMSKLKK